MKFTKGPWEVSRGAQQYPFSIESGHKTIAFINHIHAQWCPDGVTETEANAKFIVTACNNHYGLLKQLQGIELALLAGGMKNPKQWVEGIQQTIAKATGK